MPIQLANGHLRTPAFKVKRHRYWVDIWVKMDLSNEQWPSKKWNSERCCVVDADKTLIPIPGCGNGTGRRIQASWTLWDGAQLVAQGPSKKETPTCDNGGVSMMDFFLGSFQGKGGKMYVLDVELTNLDPSIPFKDALLKVWPAPEM
ncbi:MAG: hypothetical protein ABR912_15005 [Terracidiphilus sp.]